MSLSGMTNENKTYSYYASSGINPALMTLLVVAECGAPPCRSILSISVGKGQRCLRGKGLHICHALCLYSPLHNSFLSYVD